MFQVLAKDPSHQEIVAKGGVPLKNLCQKEAQSFSDWLRANEPNFSEGLAEWERHIIAVYLDKTSRGLRDEQQDGAPSDLPQER